MYFYPRFLKGVVFLGGFVGAVLGVGTDAVFSDYDVLSVVSNNDSSEEASDDEFEEVPEGYVEQPFAGVVYAQIEEVRNLLQNELANRGHVVPQPFIRGEDWGQYSLAAIWGMMITLTGNSRYHWGVDVLIGNDCFGQLYITEDERVQLSAATDFLEGRNTAVRHALALLDNVLIEIASVIGELNQVRENVRQGGVLDVERLRWQLALLVRHLTHGAWYTYYAARSDRLWGELSPALRGQIERIGELMWARAGGLDGLIYRAAQRWTILLFNQQFFPRVPRDERVVNPFRVEAERTDDRVDEEAVVPQVLRNDTVPVQRSVQGPGYNVFGGWIDR